MDYRNRKMVYLPEFDLIEEGLYLGNEDAATD
jgi:hypothetical protein